MEKHEKEGGRLALSELTECTIEKSKCKMGRRAQFAVFNLHFICGCSIDKGNAF
jgi:hypothetical protein